MNETLPQPTPDAILAEIFCVQVPPTLPLHIKQRLFTLAARDNADKVIGHPEVIALLEHVGAIVPQKTGSENLRCLGVLWNKDHPICKRCGVNITCHALASSYGLDTIRISPRLLGTKISRTPKLFPAPSTDAAQAELDTSAPSYLVYPTTDRDLELLEWLNTTLRPVMWHEEIHYNIKGTGHYPISVGKPDSLMEVRFCAPSADLKRVLKQKRSEAGSPRWLLPENATFDEAVSMINTHVASLFESNEPSHS
jgi:hypothetical protein